MKYKKICIYIFLQFATNIAFADFVATATNEVKNNDGTVAYHTYTAVAPTRASALANARQKCLSSQPQPVDAENNICSTITVKSSERNKKINVLTSNYCGDTETPYFDNGDSWTPPCPAAFPGCNTGEIVGENHRIIVDRNLHPHDQKKYYYKCYR